MRKAMIDIPIRASDIDFSGRASSLAFTRWLEAARVKMLDAAGTPIDALMKQGHLAAVLRTEIFYHHPVGLEDTLRAEAWIDELRGARYRMAFRFIVGTTIVASGTQDGALLCSETLRPVRMPQSVRGCLLPFTAGAGAG